MRGIILAAGKGSRLNGTAGDKPKCLVRAGGRTLLERQIDSLEAAGIDDVVVVVGCQAPRVRALCGQRVTYVENMRYAETNSMYSLWMARALLYEGFVVMNCDVLFHPVLLRDLMSARHPNALLLAYHEADEPPYGDEEMKVRVRCGRVTAMSKTMAADEADGENVGIVKVGRDAAPALIRIMDRLVSAGDVRAWAPRAFSELARTEPIHAIGTRGYPWIEIDFPDDYRRALSDVLPAIDGDAFERHDAPLPRVVPGRAAARLPAGTDA